MEPPTFPTSHSELDEWSVYADYLMIRGDRRGELIAHELAVAEPADLAQVRALQELARPFYHLDSTAAYGFCLGHIRTVALHWRPRRTTRHRGPEGPTLARIRDLLGTVPASRVESLALPMVPGENPWHCQQVLAALPRTCRRVELVLGGTWTTAALEDALAMIPDHVRELALRGASPFDWTDAMYAAISDRFDLVEMPAPLSSRRVIDLGDHGAKILAALGGTRRVRVRLEEWGLPWLHPRCELGAPGDAAIARDDGYPSATALARWSLITKQWNYGLVPVRTQLAGALPEGYQVAVGNDQIHLAITHARYAAHLVRRGAAWTTRDDADQQVPIRYGDRLNLPAGHYRLVTVDTATRLLRGERPDLHGSSDQ